MDNNQIIVFVLAGITLVVFVAVFVFSKLQAQKRTQALQMVAQEISLNFKGDVWNSQPKAHQFGTALFGRGSGRRFNNVTVGAADGLEINLFDYSYNNQHWQEFQHLYSDCGGIFSRAVAPSV